MNTFTRAALTVLVGLVIWFLPHTEAIKPEGWHLLAIFTATIVGFILRPWSTGIMALFGIVVAVATNSITMVQALGGYAEANVWLIVAAVFFSRGIINSGLGKRIAYTLIRSFGTSSLKPSFCTQGLPYRQALQPMQPPTLYFAREITSTLCPLSTAPFAKLSAS